MTDRMIQTMWRISVLGTIFLASLLAAASAYLGMYALITGDPLQAVPRAAVAVFLAGAILWLSVHRDELVEA